MNPQDLTVNIIARAMRIKESHLHWLADHMGDQFKKPFVKIIKKKRRSLSPPRYQFKQQCKLLHKFLQAEFKPHKIAHGGVSGTSCARAANVHKGSKIIITRDVKDCYPTIHTYDLECALFDFGFSEEVSILLSKLMTLNDCIPQGSPLSNDAVNLFFYKTDVALFNACGGWGRVTRTADDFVISTNFLDREKEAKNLLENAIVGRRLTINSKKRNDSGTRTTSQRQIVNGYCVNSKHGIAIDPKKQTDYLEFALKYVRAAKSVSYRSLPTVAKMRRILFGEINYCRSARFSNCAYLMRELRKGDQFVGKKLQAVLNVGRKVKWWVVLPNVNIDRPSQLSQKWRSALSRKIKYKVIA